MTQVHFFRQKYFILAAICGLIAIFSAFVIIATTQHAAAASTSGFSAGDIMSDAVMSNKNTLTESQVTSFLKSKNPCNKLVASAGGQVVDDSSTQAHWAGVSSIKYQIHGGQKGTTKGTFNCLANSTFSGETSSHIIYQASQDYNINPQVLIVLLQKEQGLVTDTWPNSTQLAAATGYNCPDDDAGCRSTDAAFKKQVRGAAHMFNSILTKNPYWTNYYPVGTNYIQYNPSASCGGSYVNIKNLATSALYNYTPYQPNAAALKAGYGTAPCGAYGNRNFYLYFTDWFKSTHYTTGGAIGKKYDSIGGQKSYLGNPTTNEIASREGGVYQQFEHGRIYWKSGKGAWIIAFGIGDKYLSIGGSSSGLGYPLGDETSLTSGGSYQQYEHGRIYWKSGKGTWVVAGGIGNKYSSMGSDKSQLGYPLSDEVPVSDNGTYQQYEHGRIYWKSGIGGAWAVTGDVLNYYLKNGGDKADLGYPISDTKEIDNDSYQIFEHATVYRTSNQTYVVRNAIGERYKLTGGVTGQLGAPQGNENVLASGGTYQQFKNGRIYWKSHKGAWAVTSSINSAYSARGADTSILGYPISTPVSLTNGATYQEFEGGVIYKTSQGVYSTQCAIGSKYQSDGIAKNPLGMPTSNEIALSTGGVYQQFEHGRIYWKSHKGTWKVGGGVGDEYLNLSADKGVLHYPLSDEIKLSTGGVYQQYEGGRIYWKSGKGAWMVMGGVEAKYIALGADRSKLGYPLSNEISMGKGKTYQEFEHGKIFWVPKVGATVEY